MLIQFLRGNTKHTQSQHFKSTECLLKAVMTLTPEERPGLPGGPAGPGGPGTLTASNIYKKC